MKKRFLDQVYATRNDMLYGIHRIEKVKPVEYVLTGMFDNDYVTRYPSVDDLPNFGISVSGEHLLEPQYLVVPAGTAIQTERIPQRRGGIKFAINPRLNPIEHILFHPGGLYRDEALISGEMGLGVTYNEVSVDIYELFSNELFEDFVTVKAFHVGPEALELLKKGFRLTPGIKSSREIDLQI
jgi:hypothetical protein